MGVREEFAQFAPQTTTQPQSQSGGGLFGFLKGLGSSIVNPIVETGQNIFKTGAAITSNNASTDIINRSNQEMRKNLDLFDQGKISEGELKKRNNELFSGVKAVNKKNTETQKQFQSIDPAKAAANAADSAITLGSFGTAGLLKNVAKTGVKSAVKGGILSGGLYGGSLGALNPIETGEVTTEDLRTANPEALSEIASGAVGSALGGGVTGGALGLVGNIPNAVSRGFLKKAGVRLEKGGNNLMGSQANLTRAETRRVGTNPSEVLGNLNKRLGVNSLETAARVSKNVTGQNGAYSELVRNAVGNSRGVDIGNLRTVADDLLSDVAPLITGAQRKNILEQVKNGVTSAYGGSKGSLSTLANPLDALSLSQNFRSLAGEIKRGASVSASDKQLAKVYDKLGKEIEDRLYKTPGIEEGLKLAAPDRAKELRDLATRTTDKAEAKAYVKLADELENPKLTVKDLRSLQKDFVDAAKIDELTAKAASGAGNRVGDQMQGLGKLIQRPTNMIAVPLNATTPAAGGILSTVGRKLQEAPAATGEAGSRVGGALTSNPAALIGAQGVTAPETPVGQEGTQLDQTAPEGVDTSAIYQGYLPPASDTGNIFSDENIQKLIIADLASTGGENITTLLALQKAFGKPELTTKQQESQARSDAALSAVDQIESAFDAAGGGQAFLGNLTNLAGSLKLNPEAEAFNATRNSAISLITRALGGSANSSDKDRQDIAQALPSLTDTPEAARIKLEALRERLKAGALSPDNSTLTGAAQ